MIITKEIFEAHVPSAKMPERNTSVHERLTHFFEISAFHLVSEIVSPALSSLIEDDGELHVPAQRFVCLDAFLRVIRSLDLVLTATGFGIVSTESTAPASRARVDALAEEIATQRLQVVEILVDRLRLKEGWSVSPQAIMRIPSFFFRPSSLPLVCGLSLTQDNWYMALRRALLADAHICRVISRELFNDILQRLRADSLSVPEQELVNRCMKFYAFFIPLNSEIGQSSNSQISHPADGLHAKILLDDVLAYVESNIDSFPVYAQSSLYKARHADRYENQPFDPTFFFM